MKEFYDLTICGREERLPVFVLPGGTKIAFFNLHGNVGLTEYCGGKIAEILRPYEVEILLTAESKGLQLTHVVARELGHSSYAAARKGKKIYMTEYLQTSVKAITGVTTCDLFISKNDAEMLSGKRVAIVDDVISGGGSLKGLTDLVTQSNGKLIAAACVLAEGDSVPNRDILRLADLPLL